MRARSIIAAAAVLLATAPPAAAEHLRLSPPLIGPITRHFEPPPTPYDAGHRGIDIVAPQGTTVRAPEAGLVSFAGQVGGLLHVTVDHGEVRTTASFVSALLVDQGEQVVRDQPIALSGAGHAGSADPHLHFSVRRGAEYLDPEPLLLATLRREPWRVVRLVA